MEGPTPPYPRLERFPGQCGPRLSHSAQQFPVRPPRRRNPRRPWFFLGFILLAACLMAGATSRPAHAQLRLPSTALTLEWKSPLKTVIPVLQVDPSMEGELILQLRWKRFILLDATVGYLSSNGVLLPLSEVAEALDFSITVYPQEGKAEGWFLRENRRFFLDVSRNEVVVEGKKKRFRANLVEVKPEDIYVHTSLLSEWWPLDFKLELKSSVVKVFTREPLPLEERLLREQDYKGLQGRGSFAQVKYPRLDTPYEFFSLPFIDLSMSFDYSRDEGGEGDAQENRDASYNAYITSDLLWMNMNMFVAGNDVQNPASARFNLGRKDPEGELIWPLNLYEFSLGDVYTPQLPLIASSKVGRGIVLSRFPLRQPTEFDRTTLRGDLPQGWEVELYRNQSLLEFQRSRPDGQYEFPNLPLLFGLNLFRLVFHGPQGQRREEIERFYVGTDLIPPGQFNYRIAFNQENVDTIKIGDDSGFASAEEEDIRERKFLEMEMGISQNLALALNWARFPLGSIDRSFAGLGVRTSLLGASLRIDAVQDITSGEDLARETDPNYLMEREDGEEPRRRAYQSSLLTELLGVSLSLEHARYYEFTSERVTASSDPLLSKSKMRVDTTIPLWVLPSLSFSLSVEDQEWESQAFRTTINNRLAMYIAGISFSNSVTHTLTGVGHEITNETGSGSFLFSFRIDRLSVRSNTSYNTQPDSGASSSSLTFDYIQMDGDSLRFVVNHSFIGDPPVTSMTGSFSTKFRALSLGGNLTYSTAKFISAGLSLSFGFGVEPREGSIAMRPGMAGNGAASARVFLDNNQNHVFDEGDEPLEGVKFKQHGDEESDEEGIVFLTGLRTHLPINLAIETASLEDPFWKPLKTGVEIIPRPGHTVEVDFPVVITGEIDGTVFLLRGEEEKGVSNAQVQLIDSEGKVVKEVKSEFDGFYLLDSIPPGRYRIRIAPEQIERLSLVPPSDESIEIKKDGTVIYGVDLHLKRKGKSKSPEKAPKAPSPEKTSPRKAEPAKSIRPENPREEEPIREEAENLKEKKGGVSERADAAEIPLKTEETQPEETQPEEVKTTSEPPVDEEL